MKHNLIKRAEDYVNNNPIPKGCLFRNINKEVDISKLLDSVKLAKRPINIPLAKVQLGEPETITADYSPRFQDNFFFEIRRKAYFSYDRETGYEITVEENLCQKDSQGKVQPPLERVLLFKNFSIDDISGRLVFKDGQLENSENSSE